MTGVRFTANDHRYTDLDGAELPSISALLELAGLVDDTYMTEASRIRGTAVHSLCTSWDLGALDVETCRSPHRSYLLAYVKAMSLIPHSWRKIEEANASARHGGRPDRVGTVYGAAAVLEIKCGAPVKATSPLPWLRGVTAHQIQPAMQILLEAEEFHLPAEAIGRWALYLKSNGKFKLESFTDRRDFDRARRILKEFA